MKKFFLLPGIFFFTTAFYSPPSDSFTTIGHSRIYYHKQGTGVPAVIFVSGLGEDHNTWNDVQDSIATFATTLSYDRSGLGQSEYHGEKKDVRSLANELHALLLSVRVSQPVVLVGHSLGCQIVKGYAALFPATIAGLIFLDPGYNEEKLRARVPDSIWQQREQALKMYIPKFNAAQEAEREFANKSSAASDAIKKLPKVPIVLFTATHVNPDFPASAVEFEVKKETHLLWLQTLPWATHIETERSRHYIQNDAPQLVIDAARTMVQQIRKKKESATKPS